MPYGSLVVDNIIATTNLSVAGNIAVNGNVSTSQGITVTQGTLYPLTATSAVNTTSGTSVVLSTAIPSWATRITVVLAEVSLSAGSLVMVQFGYGVTPTWQTTGYVAVGDGYSSNAGPIITNTTGFVISSVSVNANLINGNFVFNKVTNVNTWIGGITGWQAGVNVFISGGSVTLSAALTSVRLMSLNGADTFDNGKACIFYE